ncbi:nuclear transport factor 2 family protein [Dyadobacter sp. NIV53]|uniref:nuclear transport factor 2 family protein n=1 Tax=Dyadobacter sp. NIV53 TaxID=2861765 RepID=UPI001C87B743|nr:nuclear transport factor 2 family protein [Dyadobacter sp. NIV53]
MMRTTRLLFTFLFICLLAFQVSAQTNTARHHADLVSISPNADNNITVAIDYVNAIVRNDWTKVRSLITAGFMQYGPGAPDSTNADQYAKVWQEWYPIQQNREVFIIASTSLQVKEGMNKGDWVLLWLDYHALFTNENKSAHVPIQMTIMMENGKVAVERTYYDSGSLLTQLGWTMTPPQTAKK